MLCNRKCDRKYRRSPLVVKCSSKVQENKVISIEALLKRINRSLVTGKAGVSISEGVSLRMKFGG